MKIRYNSVGLPSSICDFCLLSLGGTKFTILHKGQKIIKELCPGCAAYLNEFGNNDDFELLKGI